MKKNVRSVIRSHKKIGLFFLIILLAGAAVSLFKNLGKAPVSSSKMQEQKTAVVAKGNIISELSSSGVISPKNTYSVTSLIEGEVISAEFEEGDVVEKDQILYQIDPSSMESELQSANNSLTRAKESYTEAEKDYQKVQSDYSNRTYKSNMEGYVKTLHLKKGDKVSAGTKIADLYNDQIMKLRVPFLSVEVAQISNGNEGFVTLAETGEQLACVVSAVSQLEETLSGGRLVRYVTVQVSNPGGLTTSHSATVQIGELICSMEGNFEPVLETTLSADLNSSVNVDELLITEGDHIGIGTALFRMDTESADKLFRNYKDTKDRAQESVESAQNKLNMTNDNYDNYTITAPIAGQVIKKEVKVGDKVAKSSNGSTTMAVIYDMSQMTFEMSIDELDIRKIQVGQEVEVTADAIERQTYHGTVTNISLESTNSNGVTNYPVTVTIEDAGDLLPGMNVDGRILLDQSENTLLIPVDALQRGNRVFIKDDTITTQEGNIPVGFRAVDVTVGLINESYVEIKEGLTEGNEIYLDVSSKTSQTQTIQRGMSGMTGEPPSSGGGYGGNRGSNGGGRNRGGNRP